MRVLPALFACALSGVSAATAHELVTPPVVPHPLPQGVPYNMHEFSPHPVINLRFEVVNGRRVLVDPATGRIHYRLTP